MWDGNMTNRNGTSITWNSLNMPGNKKLGQSLTYPHKKVFKFRALGCRLA